MGERPKLWPWRHITQSGTSKKSDNDKSMVHETTLCNDFFFLFLGSLVKLLRSILKDGRRK